MKLYARVLAASMIVAVVSVLATSPAMAATATQRQSAEPAAVPGELLIRFKSGTSRKGRDDVVARHRGRVVASIPALGIETVRFDGLEGRDDRAKVRAKVGDLKRNARVAFVEPNFIYRASFTPNDPSLGQQYAWGRIQAFGAWDVTQGNSATTIAIIDTGIQRSHPDLDAKILPGYDWVQDDSAPDDGNGHGTHVAGSAAAETSNATGGAGTCPNCRLMPLRVLNNSGSGTLADVAAAITYAADRNAKVINLSLGGPGSSTLQQAVDYATNRGSFLACAAGNSNTSSTSSAYPAAYPNCFAVAATTSSDARASYSNYGSWVEAAAPGSSIYSTWLNSGYNTISGTSMATPHVAGLGGLLASQGRTAAQIRERICTTADKISGTGSFWTCGRINANAAVGTSTPPPPPPPAPDKIVNGGFEGGTSPWQQSSSGGYQLITTTRPHAGAFSAWLGGYNSATEEISQTVTVPASGSLAYWWYMTTSEVGSTVWDRLQVRVYNTSGALLATPRTWSNASGAGLWRLDNLSLAAYAGQTVRVAFRATTDVSLPSSFFVDDVSLK